MTQPPPPTPPIPEPRPPTPSQVGLVSFFRRMPTGGTVYRRSP